MNKNHISLPIVYLLIAIRLFASNDPVLESKVNSWMENVGGLRFLENKGQMMDLQDGYSPTENRVSKRLADTNLLFKSSSAGLDMYITTSGLSYVFIKTERQVMPQLSNSNKTNRKGVHSENESTTVQYCRADMELVGADIRKKNIIKEYESEDRIDYYLPQCPDGLMNVHSYERITIRNIYPGIDWVLYSVQSTESSVNSTESSVHSPEHGSFSNESELKTQDTRLKTNTSGFKYDFIVHPGADPSLISLRYKWTDKPSLQRDGSLKISTPMGAIVEGIPVSYGEDKEIKVNTHYSLQGDEIKFKIDKYDKAEVLTIDPTLVWATYYGGGVFSEVQSVCTDGQNVWVTGKTNGGGFPTNNPLGAAYFQGSYGGANSNLFILEFSTCGQLIWATYYGGSSGNGDIGNSISSDKTNVWVTGSTSSTDFPVQNLPGAYNQSTREGASANAFILEFNCVTNARVWATYYGGNGNSLGNSISSDGKSVWVTGAVSSSTFPIKTLAGAYNQSAPGGVGAQNAFISQFSCASSNLLWSTYYGGNLGDYGASISSDGLNVWVTGGAGSPDFPTLFLAGAYNQPIKGGDATITNAFILRFSASTETLLWATFYGGSGGGIYTGDYGTSISSDGKNVWMTGNVISTDFPIQSFGGAYNQLLKKGTGTNINAFVLQFSCTSSARIWATYYGSTGNASSGDLGFSIQSDGVNVWVCGETSSSDFPTMNSACGYFSDTIGAGGSDVFVLQFNAITSVRKWATFYGTDNENDGSYISSDGTNVFVAADASSVNTYPVKNTGMEGTYFEMTNTGNDNLIMTKFNISCSSVLTVSPDTMICSSGSAKLVASGGSGYTWLPASGLSSTTIANPIATPTVTTTYTVSSTTGGSACTGGGTASTATVTVKLTPAITATASQSSAAGCGKSDGVAVVLANGGTGMLTYSWSNGSLTPSDSSLSSGTYTITVKDSLGCQKSSVAAISNVPSPTITGLMQDSVLCYGGSMGSAVVTATTSNGPLSYKWNNGLNTASINNLTAGTYVVSVTDASMCSAVSTVTIAQPASAVNINTIIVTNASCKGSDGALAATALGGTGSLSYSWSTGATNSSITNLPANNYTLTVTDIHGCSSSSAATVSSAAPGTAQVSTSNVSCYGGNDGSVMASITAGSSPYTYAWSNGDSSITNSTSSSISNLSINTYSVTVTDGNGCQSNSSAVLTQPGSISVIPSGNSSTCGNSNGSVWTKTSGGTGTFNYSWSNNSDQDTVTNLPAGIYTLTVTDGNNCTVVTTASIANANGPNIRLNTTNSCRNKAEGTITAITTGTGTLLYSWSNGQNTQNLDQLPVGNYTLTVTDGLGCTYTTTTSITQLPDPLISAGPTATITTGQSIELTASGGISYLWTPSASLNNDTIYNPLASPTQTTSYTVMITDQNNCTATDNVLITVRESLNCDSINVANTIFIPTAFSPNADGQNDAFHVRLLQASCITSVKLELYDRWGEQVFATTDLSIGWDGYFRGKQMETAVFGYYLTATLSSGQNVFKKGNVTLLK